MRSEVFRINQNHDLMHGLMIAGLCQAPGAKIYKNSGLMGDGSCTNITNYAQAFVYDTFLDRFVLKLTRTSSHYIAGPTYTGTPSSLSASFWFKVSNAALNYPNVIGNNNLNTDLNGFSFYFYGSEPIIDLSTASANTYARYGSGILVTNTWQHYACSYNRGYFYTYLNGKQLAQTSGTSQGSFSNPVMGTYPINIGVDGTVTSSFFVDGYIGDPMLWIGRALSFAEIQTLADPTNININGLIALPKRKYYSFNYTSQRRFAKIGRLMLQTRF